MKKILALALVLTMVVSLFAACGGSEKPAQNNAPATEAGQNAPAANAPASSGFKKMKIAVATSSVDEIFVSAQKCYNEVMKPALNVEFMYSEELKDAGAMTTFIENAYASGCDAVMCNLSNSIDQAAAVCDELGMYFVGIASADAKENTNLPYYVSVTGASAEGYGTSYANVIKNTVGDGKEHSILILSGAACYGATSFIEGTAGSLRALQDVYGLKYDEDVMALATAKTQVDATNDKGVKITVFPGMADLAALVSPLLQTGDYDVVVGTTNILDSLAVAVDEVEKAMGFDIKFISRNAFNASCEHAFNNNDSQGSPILDGMVCAGTYEYVASVLILRNAFDGYVDNMRNGDACSRVPGMPPLSVCTADEYNILSDEKMPFSFMTAEDMLSLCGPNVTWQDIDAFGAKLTTQSIIDKFN